MASEPLTGRELEVLQECAKGLSDAEIATKLDISPYTVGNHLRRILRKTGSANRANAVGKAIAAGLIIAEDASERSVHGVKEKPARSSSILPPAVALLPAGKESRIPRVHRRSLELIGLLQRAGREAEGWNTFLRELASEYGSHLPMISWTHLPSHGEISITASPELEHDWVRRYDERYARLNPMFRYVARQPGDFFATTEDLPLPQEFMDHPFYREYMRPLNMHQAVAWTVFPDPSWSTTLLLGQAEAHGTVTPAERELGFLLFPHIRITLRQLWNIASSAEDHARAILTEREGPPSSLVTNSRDGAAGVLLLDRRGRLQFANEEAERLLSEGKWLSHTAAGLVGEIPEDTSRLKEAIDRAAAAAEGRLYAAPAVLLMHGKAPDLSPIHMSIAPLVADGNGPPAPVPRARVIVTLSRLLSAAR